MLACINSDSRGFKVCTRLCYYHLCMLIEKIKMFRKYSPYQNNHFEPLHIKNEQLHAEILLFLRRIRSELGPTQRRRELNPQPLFAPKVRHFGLQQAHTRYAGHFAFGLAKKIATVPRIFQDFPVCGSALPPEPSKILEREARSLSCLLGVGGFSSSGYF